MLDFIGLPWDARCIDFHQCERTVSTASNWQVRQRISKTSVLRWRNYEKFVGPLQKLMDLGRSVAPEPRERDAAETTQLLGNILRRAEQSLRVDDDGAACAPFDETGLHARRVAQLALALR